MGKPADAVHGVCALMGVSDEDRARFVLDKETAIQREFEPGLGVLREERSFRDYQSGQNARKAAICATCRHTTTRLLCMCR